MSKTYIVSRNGGTVTKAPINDNKIPIYDSEQDVKADINNMSEDQLYGYPEPKFDIDDMKQYIRNQNVLSDYENFAITTTNQELQYDGVWVGASSGSGSTNIYINDVIVTGGQYGGSGYGDGLCVVFRKGDKIRFSPDAPKISKIAYYKLRDYSDR